MLNLLRIKTIQVQDLPFRNSSAWRCQKPCQKAPWDEGIQVSCVWVSKLKPFPLCEPGSMCRISIVSEFRTDKSKRG